MFKDVSYRIKVPLAFVFVILTTGLFVTLILTWRTVDDLRDELFDGAVKVGGVVNDTLVSAIKQDNVWLAYQTLKSASFLAGPTDERVSILLDTDHTIIASDHPTHFPIDRLLREINAEMARLNAKMENQTPLEPYLFEYPNSQRIYIVAPVLNDGVALGMLVTGYSRAILLPRFYAIVGRVVVALLAVMLVLVPLGAYLGKRMTMPLGGLARCLARVGKEPPGEISCNLHLGNDEIGQLGRSFEGMIKELDEKTQLEKQVVKSEQLAAVGRLAAGVAHEINNPLGGMLNAINTFKHHGSKIDFASDTMALVERGLYQIRDTVSALLVEARMESHPLTPQDIDDIYSLIVADAQKRTVKIDWNNELREVVSLPSTQTRQILINLSMNAVQASQQGGNVWCFIQRERDDLRIRVENDSGQIDAEKVERLFEPFVHDNPSGHGLGLWVTYRLVQQLAGKIDVNNEAGRTVFSISLPLQEVA